jgi:hypothetical protein
VVGAYFPSFAGIILAICCFVVAGLQPVGFVGVLRVCLCPPPPPYPSFHLWSEYQWPSHLRSRPTTDVIGENINVPMVLPPQHACCPIILRCCCWIDHQLSYETHSCCREMPSEFLLPFSVSFSSSSYRKPEVSS